MECNGYVVIWISTTPAWTGFRYWIVMPGQPDANWITTKRFESWSLNLVKVVLNLVKVVC